MKNILRELPKVVSKYQARVVIVLGLLDLFEDPNIKKREAKRVIERIMKSLGELSNRLLVITSLQASGYGSMIVPKFEKRIMLTSADRRKVNVEIHNESKNSDVTITERDLNIVRKK